MLGETLMFGAIIMVGMPFYISRKKKKSNRKKKVFPTFLKI